MPSNSATRSPPPFSYLDESGNRIGYSIDICLKVVDAIKRELKRPDLAVKFVPVTSVTRYPMLIDGQIDLECANTPSTAVDRKRVAFTILGRSPVERQLAFARERGWRNFKFYATVGDDFARDYRGLAPDGSEWASLDVWVKRDGKVHHFWAAENSQTADPGQDSREAPNPSSLWTILDLTPAGRGANWYPKLDYSEPAKAA